MPKGRPIATRKRIARMLIEEVVVRVKNDGLDLVIRWVSDDHAALRVRKNRTGRGSIVGASNPTTSTWCGCWLG
jgi:hypothetical protein